MEKKEVVKTVVFFGLLIVGGYIFYLISSKKYEENEEFCRENGVRVVALFSHTTGQRSSVGYRFSFKVNGEEYLAALRYGFKRLPHFPYKETPMLVAYDPEDPNNNVCVPEEEFDYKGCKIHWIKPNDSYHYLMMMKVDE